MNTEPLTVDQFPGETAGHHVICPKGPVTLDNLAALRVALEFDTGNTTLLDLTSVPYIDSAGLGLLMGAYVSRRKTGRTLVLTGVNQRVLNLLHITGVERLLLIFPNLDRAIQALSTSANA
jgi:anti-sigma B factor antagonist